MRFVLEDQEVFQVMVATGEWKEGKRFVDMRDGRVGLTRNDGHCLLLEGRFGKHPTQFVNFRQHAKLTN